RQDWPAALRQAGFDPRQPSVWSAEGLLPFLPAAAQDLLFERVQLLSAVGSRIAVEGFGPDFNDPDARARQRALMQRYREIAAQVRKADIPDFEDLWYFEDRTDVADWLRGHGWEVTAVTADQMMARYQRFPPAEIDDPAPRNVFVSAQRSGT
ncbi:MAG: SAM-dependent methyltransferase, partial [Mycobacterium sp.]